LRIKLFYTSKLSRINIALVLFTLTFILSAYALNDILTRYGETYGVDATKLNEKPETYFPLDNPDSYVLEAISNPNKTVIIAKEIFSGISIIAIFSYKIISKLGSKK